MKRTLALVGAILFATVMAQASTVDWTVSGLSGKTFYLYNGDLSSTIAALQDGETYTKENLALPSGYADSGSIGARGTSGKTDNAEAYFTVIVPDSTVEDGKAFSYAVVSTSGKTYDPPNQSPGKLTINSWSSGTFKAVPEPTSVALIALGLVALGLKRKVA